MNNSDLLSITNMAKDIFIAALNNGNEKIIEKGVTGIATSIRDWVESKKDSDSTK